MVRYAAAQPPGAGGGLTYPGVMTSAEIDCLIGEVQDLMAQQQQKPRPKPKPREESGDGAAALRKAISDAKAAARRKGK